MLNWADSLWAWITANATVFSGLTSIGMLLIWGIYLQLMLHNFRMQRKPQILINRGHGRDINSRCIISNMSQSAVFIENIVVRLETSQGSWYSDVTDTVDELGQKHKHQSPDMTDPHALSRMTRQGPLDSAQYMEGGSFGALIKKVATEHGCQLDEDCQPANDMTFRFIEIGVIAIFGSENKPIGARRRFNIEAGDDEAYKLVPVRPGTQQLTSRRNRLEIRRWQRSLM